MKLTFILLLLATSISLSQVPDATFYGEEVERYKGLRLKVVSSPLPYSHFILDKDRPWNAPANTYMPIGEESVSDPHKLYKKEFIVTDVLEHPFDEGIYLLALKEAENGKQIYYYYNPEDKNSFPMQVMRDATGTPIGVKFMENPNGITYNSGDLCSQIVASRDKFTGAVSYNSPYSSRYNALVYKNISKSKGTTYSLGLYTTGSTVSTDGKGVIILLDNKARINRPAEKIDVEAKEYDTHGYGDFVYSVYLKLTPAERDLLLKHRITDFRLYIYDKEISEIEGEGIKQYLKCLINRK